MKVVNFLQGITQRAISITFQKYYRYSVIISCFLPVLTGERTLTVLVISSRRLDFFMIFIAWRSIKVHGGENLKKTIQIVKKESIEKKD